MKLRGILDTREKKGQSKTMIQCQDCNDNINITSILSQFTTIDSTHTSIRTMESVRGVITYVLHFISTYFLIV